MNLFTSANESALVNRMILTPLGSQQNVSNSDSNKKTYFSFVSNYEV